MRDYFQELREMDYKEVFNKYWHIAYLAIISLFVLLIRIRPRSNFFSNGKVYFGGNDAWYHFRQTMYSVRNWPYSMNYDPWTGYPDGATVGHFGTLYDQIIATISIVVSLGNPTPQTVRTVMVFAPPVIAALTVIVVYLIGKQLMNRKAGVLAATLLAIIPGTFLSRTLVGFADHHAAEVLFMSIVVLVAIIAFKNSEEEKFIIEDLSSRGEKFVNLIKYSLALSIAFLLYMLIWPPAIMAVGITGVFYLSYSLFRISNGKSHESILLVGGISTVALSIMILPFSSPTVLNPTTLGGLQILISLTIGLGCFFLIGFHRVIEKKGYEKYYFVAIPLIITILSVLTWALTPELFNSLKLALISNFGLSASDTLHTIGEAQSMISRGSLLVQFATSYGGIALFMFAFYLVIPFLNYKESSEFLKVTPEYSYLTVWSFMLLLAALTQVRFNYYLAIAASITAAVAVLKLMSLLPDPDQDSPQGWYYIAITMVLVVLIAPTAPIVGPAIGGTSVYEQSSNVGPGGYMNWEDSLEWVNENTPEIEMDTYGEYQKESFEYPEDSYGIMSWWDYGHWITVTSERIPFANPFQQNAKPAANFLLAQSPEEAEEVVENIGSEEPPRYVMIDWDMVSPTSKFGAPLVWSDRHNTSEFIDYIYSSSRGRLTPAAINKKQNYYNSMMVRLYQYHGTEVRPAPVVTNYDEIQGVKVAPRGSDPYLRFNSTEEARRYVQNDSTSKLGGVGIYPSENVEALENYRYVMGSNKSVETAPDFVRNVRSTLSISSNVTTSDFVLSTSYTKVFERVPGAEIVGEGAPPNSTVSASVRLREPHNDEQFVYRQIVEADSNGEFNMTIPYSTTGYDNWGVEEGYTNPSVRAVGKYTIRTSRTRIEQVDGEARVIRNTEQFDVPEAKVIGEDSSPISVNMNNTDS